LKPTGGWVLSVSLSLTLFGTKFTFDRGRIEFAAVQFNRGDPLESCTFTERLAGKIDSNLIQVLAAIHAHEAGGDTLGQTEGAEVNGRPFRGFGFRPEGFEALDLTGGQRGWGEVIVHTSFFRLMVFRRLKPGNRQQIRENWARKTGLSRFIQLQRFSE
jgi:hypothetical protein